MNRHLLLCILLFVGFWAMPASGQATSTDAVVHVEEENNAMLLSIGTVKIELVTPVVFLFGAFCALWAQNTGRNPWLWFFLGLLFSVFTIFFVLTKNANDLQDRKIREWVGR